MPTFWNAVMPPIDDTWMMCPLRCARRYGSAACVTHSAPNTLVAIGHVEPDRQQRFAVLLGEIVECRGVARGGRDLVSHARLMPAVALLIPGLRMFTGSFASVSRASLEKNPHEVASMFDAVARRYDLTNTVLSLGQDRFWRRATRSALRTGPGDKVLDLAAGTAVSTVELAASGAWCVAADFSVGMLAAGAGRPVPKVGADATRLPFGDDVFDAVTISFGLRNVVDHGEGLREMARVTRPGGRLVVCEFSTPTNALFATVYKEYLMQALPRIATAVSSNPEAYVYLAESIRAWPDQAQLARRIADAGWSAVRWRNLSGGIVALHAATKPLR
jgi:demethylmenaquinone methyltransferase/2-methoxy-6-polyprenyl-1,4-benzoquinol methylase